MTTKQNHKMEVKIKKINKLAKTPVKAHNTDAGFDLFATSCVFDKKGNATYGTGLAFEIPDGYVGLIFPRSSCVNKDLSLGNSVGVIDSGYRGEVTLRFKPTLVFVDKDLHKKNETDYDGSDQTNLSTQDVTFYGRTNNYPKPRVYEIGDRIGQIIIIPYPSITFVESDVLSDSERGTGGYGSTGH